MVRGGDLWCIDAGTLCKSRVVISVNVVLVVVACDYIDSEQEKVYGMSEGKTDGQYGCAGRIRAGLSQA